LTEPQSFQGAYAGFVSRAIAFGIDLAIATGITAALSWVLVRPVEIFGIDLSSCSVDSLLSGGETGIRGIWCIAYLFGLPIVLAITFVSYYVILWTLTGWTIGKGMIGMRVVRVNGKPMNLGRSLLRYLSYVVSLVPLGAGFFWVIISDRRQGWHDKIAGTFVLYSWEARESQTFLDRVQGVGQRIAERRQRRQTQLEATVLEGSAMPVEEVVAPEQVESDETIA
jgi:uncharacterized RDD family membrane protein YckC